MKPLTDRRSLLRGALTAGAVASVAAVPAIAAAQRPDPVIAVIAAHKTAWARIEFGGSDHEAFLAAMTAVDTAFEELTKTPPTTKAGMRGLLEHLDEWIGESGDFYDYGLLLRSPVLAG